MNRECSWKEPRYKKKKNYITMYHKLMALNSYENPWNVLYGAVQPDSVLKRNLTCCFETNLVHSRNFKNQKYKNIKSILNLLSTLFLEVSSLCFISKAFKSLEKFLLKSNINCNRFKQKMSETTVKGSYYIYSRRSKDWNNSQLMKFIW